MRWRRTPRSRYPSSTIASRGWSAPAGFAPGGRGMPGGALQPSGRSHDVAVSRDRRVASASIPRRSGRGRTAREHGRGSRRRAWPPHFHPSRRQAFRGFRRRLGGPARHRPRTQELPSRRGDLLARFCRRPPPDPPSGGGPRSPEEGHRPVFRPGPDRPPRHGVEGPRRSRGRGAGLAGLDPPRLRPSQPLGPDRTARHARRRFPEAADALEHAVAIAPITWTAITCSRGSTSSSAGTPTPSGTPTRPTRSAATCRPKKAGWGRRHERRKHRPAPPPVHLNRRRDPRLRADGPLGRVAPRGLPASSLFGIARPLALPPQPILRRQPSSSAT